MLYAIHNLSSSQAFSAEPWHYETEVPKEVKQSKDMFVRWCQKPTTKNCHFSAFEGLDPMRRVSGDNPAVVLHGLIVDYDAEVTTEMMQNLIENSPTEFVPNWGSLTFSNGGRLVWFFEEPVTLANSKHTKAFLKVASRKLKLVKLLPGLDLDAFLDPSQYYEKGRNWRNLSNDRIPSNFVHQWMYEAGNRIKWESEDSLTIPMKILSDEVERKFPGKWKGPFEEGNRGVRFWDPDADNSTAAVIRESGMQCFTGDVGFVSWRDIFGSQFVDEYEADKTGEIMASIFYDGKVYWRKDPDGMWFPVQKEDVRLLLKVKYGLSAHASRKESASEVDRVMFAIQEQKAVVGALPFVHFPSGVIYQNGQKYLNTSAVRCMEPADITGGWGENFPWLADFIENFFNPDEQADYFVAWWKHFYENALRQDPQAGQALFIAGEPGVGKTLLSTAIVSRSVGGHVDASAYLLGEEKFTSHIVGSPIMSVDDTVPASDMRRHTRYSAMIKKISANRTHLYEEKFQKAGQVTWLGRVVVSCNLDPESVKLLPNVELSLLDKICLFKCANTPREFPPPRKLQEIIGAELPHFLAWLLEWEIPEHCKGASRYGVASYHEKSLFNAALQTSPSFSFLELLLDFLDAYKESVSDECSYWEGTATSLLADMSLDPRIGSIATKYTPNQIASFLGQLKSRGYKFNKVRSASRRVWRIPFDLENEVNRGQG